MPSCAIKNGQILLDGRPFVLRAGELHYARIPRDYWRHRLELVRAMGLNSVCAYLFWNHHETGPGEYDFDGERDVAAFCRIAAELGLWVVLRPGPYVCAEWDLGGIPSRLLAEPDVLLRSSDPRFLGPALDWFGAVCRELAPLQVGRGGPIVLVQVENEYGAFGNDKAYLKSLVAALRTGGFDVPLVRCDWTHPPQMTAGAVGGDLDGEVHMVANFGADAQGNINRLQNAFPEGPKMSGEFWTGWFDWFGHPHNGGDPVAQARQLVDLEWMLANDVSFSLYMLHGGTSFGFSAGGNARDGEFKPYVTSYDFNAPGTEQGRHGERYASLRELIQKYTPGRRLPAPPAPPPCLAIDRFELNECAPLFGSAAITIRTAGTRTMEQLGQAHGCLLYRTDLAGRQSGEDVLRIKDVHDYGIVFMNGRRVGTLDRRLNETELRLSVPESGPAVLEIFVEAMGHVNFGAELSDDRKGITRRVEHGWLTLSDWEIEQHPLDIAQIRRLDFGRERVASGQPAFYRGHYSVGEPADTHLDLRGWSKGHVWVNGRHLGRYWSIGPQQTLYLPAPWQVTGLNEVIVLDLLNEAGAICSLCGVDVPVLDAQTPASG
jgi:beta-galactosidase